MLEFFVWNQLIHLKSKEGMPQSKSHAAAVIFVIWNSHKSFRGLQTHQELCNEKKPYLTPSFLGIRYIYIYKTYKPNKFLGPTNKQLQFFHRFFFGSPDPCWIMTVCQGLTWWIGTSLLWWRTRRGPEVPFPEVVIFPKLHVLDKKICVLFGSQEIY